MRSHGQAAPTVVVCLHTTIDDRDKPRSVNLSVHCDDEMKRLNEILCVVVAIATGSSYAIDYTGGRQGWPLTIGFFPARGVTFLITVLCLMSLVILLVDTCYKRGPAAKTVLLLVLACVLFALGFAISPTKLFLTGFRQRIKTTVSPAELREIAQVCHDKLPIDRPLPGPQKWSLWNESEHRSQWNLLVESTSLGKLDPSLVIFNREDTVEISWGGALGHWGLIIRAEGKPWRGDLGEGIKTYAGP